MKKKIFLLSLLSFIFLPISVKAAPSGSLSCSVSSSTVSIGETVTVRVSGSSSEAMWDTTMGYSSNVLEKTGGNDVHVVETDFVTSSSYTYTFRAINEGTGTISVNSQISDFYGVKAYPSTSCSVNVVAPSSSSGGGDDGYTYQNINDPEKSDLSADNSLKSISIDNVKLTPDFKTDVLNYDAILLSDEKTTINIQADVNDEKAKVSGIGSKEVDLGVNKFEIIVEAENGSTRTYTINLTVNEKNPTIVNINNKKYTLMRKLNGIDVPSDFEKTVVKIDNKQVEAFKSKKYGYILVALVDENNNSSLYLYKNNKYTKFNNIKSNNLNLLILDENVKNLPYKYKKIKIVINKEPVTAYALETNSDFRLVFAINLENNEKAFYLYDMKENTFQRFYNTQVEIYLDLIKKCKIGFIIAGGFILIQFFIFICLKASLSKVKKKINNYNVNKDLEDQIMKKSKKEVKEDKKKEKKAKKEKKKTFIDE